MTPTIFLSFATFAGVLLTLFLELHMKQSVIDLNTQITAMQGSITTLTTDLGILEAVVTQTDDPDVVAAVAVLTAANAEFAGLVTRLTADVNR